MKSVPDELKTLTVKEVMSLLGIKSQTTMYKLMDEDRLLPYRKFGKLRRFTYDDVKRYLENCKVKTTSSRTQPHHSPQLT